MKINQNKLVKTFSVLSAIGAFAVVGVKVYNAIKEG